MPRRQFLKDFKNLEVNPPQNVKDISLHDGEQISFVYTIREQGEVEEIALKLIPTSLDDYPLGSGYIIFTDDHHMNQTIVNSLESLQSLVEKLELSQALTTIAFRLAQITSTTTSYTRPIHSAPVYNVHDSDDETSPPALDRSDQGHETAELDWHESDLDSDNGFGFADTDIVSLPAGGESWHDRPVHERHKIREDLLSAKRAGFRIGVYGQLHTGGTVCISVRITKLGISVEAMKAWGLDKSHYLTLLIRFKRGYRRLDLLKEDKNPTDYIVMHAGMCDTYKPTSMAISEAFDQSDADSTRARSHGMQESAPGSLRPLFIGKPLNEMLRDRFARIVKFRSFNLSWAGAESLFNQTQGAMLKHMDSLIQKLREEHEVPHKRALPAIVMSDTLAEEGVSQASLPLVAMQFLLRHLVRCTEFCLACHCQTSDTFEALKPYVCSKPLCLYQFLSYGFGPPVEYEIMKQPLVVDLLISLCFSQAAFDRLKEIPRGINLKVPVLRSYLNSDRVLVNRKPHINSSKEFLSVDPKDIIPSFHAMWQPEGNRLRVDNDSRRGMLSLRGGEWLAIDYGEGKVWHFRVKNVHEPYIYLEHGFEPTYYEDQAPVALPNSEEQVECFMHDHDFDNLSPKFQQQAILAMLRCIPNVSVLQNHLSERQKGRRIANLHDLKNIPLAARDLLRWIIASNRSCIMQVDTVDVSISEMEVDSAGEQPNIIALEPRVSGMDEWIQFRFAQGAPDKEQRFLDAVRKHATSQQYPTIFAWHGSPIYNWHSIIRQGLNFDVILHGRANGHGVYMSNQLQTSLSYTTQQVSVDRRDYRWPNTKLTASQVVSLQEVVNAPSSFVSRSPHLVVAQKDWIQTRYLFIRTQKSRSVQEIKTVAYEQDPQYRVYGSDGSPINIPSTAVAQSRREDVGQATLASAKRRKLANIENWIAMDTEDDNVSVATLAEDLLWVELDNNIDEVGNDADMRHAHDASTIFSEPFPDGSNTVTIGNKRRRGGHKYDVDPEQTRFTPGSLDISNIVFLKAPTDATSSATKALMRALNEALRAQETTLLHELGFYINPDHMQNMYQWIVELHSFDDSLPLAQDLKEAGLTSIVLELRFTSQFPFSPPFVRVIKPRFLPFLQGGGGHVTEGGAICMELLTSNGWSAVLSIESILLQIRLAMSEKERPARLLRVGVSGAKGVSRHSNFDTGCYGIGEAVTAFRRACSKHGWKEPEGVDSLVTQG